ncbi:MAG: hypothetical protein EAZ57_04580 [Cytophagales bacterium]|nr:MAG: hypothetical protein EAZ67_05600 [Cytophagales bacterium]TAF61272.1 MAG: hypothetical protein EAZ57_04580 [Cytophagales bacterium]
MKNAFIEKYLKNYACKLGLLLVCMAYCLNGKAQALPVLDSMQCIRCIGQMSAFRFSYTDLTPGKVVYKLYAVKQKKVWVLMMTDGIELMAFYAQKPKKKEQLVLSPAPPLLTEAICQIFKPQMLRNKAKTVWIGDQRLDNYYKTTRRSKGLLKDVLVNLNIAQAKRIVPLPF